MILPLQKHLENHGVQFDYNFSNVIINDNQDKRFATEIIYTDKANNPQSIALTENDLVFITNGGCTDTSSYGSQNEATDLSGIENGVVKHGIYGKILPNKGMFLVTQKYSAKKSMRPIG